MPTCPASAHQNATSPLSCLSNLGLPQGHGLPGMLRNMRCLCLQGLALGGGIGMAMRQHGLTCDSILGAQLVLANGTLVSSCPHAAPVQHISQGP